MSIRLVLADDHRVLRHGLRALLETEPDMEVVGEADTGQAAIDVVLQTRPDVVLMDLIMPEMQTPTESPERLTAREFEVLQFVAGGLANKAIAWNLRISEKTVKSHVSTILGKFGLESRTQAALYAARNGLVGAEAIPLPRSELLAPRNIVSMEMVRRTSTGRDLHTRRTL